jgi:hypothetical protein
VGEPLRQNDVFLAVLASDSMVNLPPLTLFHDLVVETDGQQHETPDRIARQPPTQVENSCFDTVRGAYYTMYYNSNWRSAMGIRTVRLDEDTEATLARLRRATGMSISEVLKRGLKAYEQLALQEREVRPYEIYKRLDLGKGGWALAPASDAKHAVREAIRRKHSR